MTPGATIDNNPGPTQPLCALSLQPACSPSNVPSLFLAAHLLLPLLGTQVHGSPSISLHGCTQGSAKHHFLKEPSLPWTPKIIYPSLTHLSSMVLIFIIFITIWTVIFIIYLFTVFLPQGDVNAMRGNISSTLLTAIFLVPKCTQEIVGTIFGITKEWMKNIFSFPASYL